MDESTTADDLRPLPLPAQQAMRDDLARPHGMVISDSLPFGERTEWPTDCVFEGICPRDGGSLTPLLEDNQQGWARCETCGAFWHGELLPGVHPVHVEGQW